MKKTLIFFFVSCIMSCFVHADTILYVNPQTGSADGNGSADKPFSSLVGARNLIRQMDKSSCGQIVVELSGKFDFPVDNFELTDSDSGASAENPVIYRAGKDGALLVGGYSLPESGFQKITDPSVLNRLKTDVQDKVYQFDLKTVGLTTLEPLPDKFSGWNELELFSSDARKSLARFPNKGWLEIAKVIDRGVKPIDKATGEWEFGDRGGVFEYSEDEPARWNVEKGIWMNGFWRHDWANETLRIGAIDKQKKQITSKAVHTYGIGNSSAWHTAKRRYYVFNLLEELDAPGEWYVDRENCVLYYYPDESGLKQIVVSVQKKPIILFNKAKNVVLKGLAFKYSTGAAVSVNNCESVVLDGLRVSNITINAVSVNGGSKCAVRNCDIGDIGSTCLSVYAGDRKTLVPCEHEIVGNHLHDSGKLHRTQGKCLAFGGVGIHIDHNYIHDAPYIAVAYGGNDNTFEYNEVCCAMMESGDGGGLYTGRDWGSQGNVVRYNYFHHFGKSGVDWQIAQGLKPDYEPLKENVMVMGVYLDDCDSGETVENNIFYKAGWAAFVGGGRYNKILNNLFVDCTAALHLDTRGLKRARPGEGTKDGWDLSAKIEQYNYKESPWKDRYPWLVNIMDDEPKLPLHNVFAKNVAINCPQWLQFHEYDNEYKGKVVPRLDFHENLCISENVKQSDKDRFPQDEAGKKRVEFRSQSLPYSQAPDQDGWKIQDSPEFKAAAPWFERIPLEKIGPQK